MKKKLLLFLFFLAYHVGFSQADIKVINTNFQDKYVPGSTITYTISVINYGSVDATNVVVTTLITNGISQKNWTGPNDSGGNSEINHTIPTLVAGKMVSYIMKIIVPQGFTGDLKCTVNAVSPLTDPNPGNNSITDTDTRGTSADISVTNTNYQIVYTPGTTTTYIVTVKNDGPLTAGGVAVTNAIPAGITNYSWTGSNGSSGTNVGLNNNIGTLLVGKTITYTITADIPASFTGNLTNSVSATSVTIDSNPANNTAIVDKDVPLSGADLQVINTDGVTTYKTGTTKVYTLTVKNNGPSAAVNVLVTNAVPAGITNFTWTGSNGSSGTGGLSNTIPSLVNGATVTYTITLDVPSSFTGNLINEASAVSDTVDLYPECPGCIDIDTLETVTDVSITNTNNQGAYIPGGTSVYTVTVTNNGPQLATGIVVQNAIPAGITNFSWSGNGASGTTALNNTIATLLNGQSIVYTITMQIPAGLTGNLVSTATANVGTSDTNTVNNTATDEDSLGAGADIVVVNTNNQKYYTQGGISTYTVSVTNNGPLVAANVLVTNAIPAGITAFSWDGNGANGTNVPLSNIIPTLAVGQTIVYTIIMGIPSGQNGSVVSTANATSATPDPNPSCLNCVDTDLSPSGLADITIINSDGAGVSGTKYVAGQTRVYTVTVTNNGPGAAANVVVTGNLSAGITLANVSWTGDNGTSGTGNLNTTLATLANGASVIYTVTVPVPSGFSQTENLVHQITYTSTTTDPTPECFTCTDIDTPNPFADIVTYKTNNQEQYLLDDVVTYVITIRNDGPSDALNVLVTDSVPSGIDPANVSWTSSTGMTGTGNIFETIPVIEANTVVIYKVTVKVKSFFSSITGNLVNVVQVSTSTPDINLNNNNDSDVDTPRVDYVTVDSIKYTPTQLIKDVLINEPCVVISNFSASSATNAFGYFHGNNSKFPFREGIIIRSGIAKNTEGKYLPKAVGQPGAQTSTGSGIGDADLNAILAEANFSTDTQDASFIKFNFTPTVEEFSFNFLFASEEYGTYQCDQPGTGYVDAFAFILTNLNTGVKQNLAIVPNTTTLISVPNIRKGTYNGSCGDLNVQYFGRYNDNGFGTGPDVGRASSAINLKGQTTSLIAKATVVPNTPYSIKLVISDIKDKSLDSAVFLEAGSFNIGGPKITGTGIYSANTDFSGDNAFCEGTPRMLKAGSGPNPNVTYTWKKDDVIIPGATSYNLEVSEAGTYTVVFTYGAGGASPCQQSDDIVVEFKPTPYPMQEANDLYACATTPFNLTLNEPVVMADYNLSDFQTFYFTSLEDALAGTPLIPSADVVSYAGFEGQQIWMKMVNEFDGGGDCDPIKSFILHYTSAPSGTFLYAEDGGAAGFCSGAAIIINPTPLDLTTGGGYTATPAGLTIDETSGAINLATSLVGEYEVSYIFNAPGCSPFTVTTNVSIISCADTFASNSGDVCLGTEFFDLTATDAGAGATYEWSLNGVVFSTDQSPQDVAVPTAAGSYVYSVIATVNGAASAPSSTTLIVHPASTASFVSTSTTICTNSTTTLVFSGTPNSSLTISDGSVTYNVPIDASGNANFVTPALANDTTFTLVDVTGPTTPACTTTLNNAILISVGLPTASIVKFTDAVICSGTATGLEISGTPGATVSYTKEGVAQTPVVLPASGLFTIPTGTQTVTATTVYTYALTGVVSSSTPPCSDTITGQSATLTVNALPTATFLTTTPSICEGSSAILEFTGTPNAIVTYNNGATDLTTTLNATGTSSVTTAAISATTTYTLVKVEVTSSGVTCSQTLAGNVTITMKPNVAITSPTANYTVTICPGTSQTFTVVATGANPTYQWYKNGTAITANATGASYTINPVVAASAGDYTVIVSGDCGLPKTSVIATLVVSPETIITTQPVTPAAVCEGTPVPLSVNATGGGTITYQWFKGTTAIAGATSATYTLNNPVSTDSGSYTVKVTGTCGTVTSNAVVVTINKAPGITTQPKNSSICVGQTATFEVVATGSNLIYQWFKGTTSIPNANASIYNIPNATEADSGTFYCQISSASCPDIQTVTVDLLVKPLPIATISEGNPSTICAGESTQIIFNGTPGAVVIYKINGGSPETVELNATTGEAIVATGILNATTVYELISVTYTGVDACSQNLTGSATVTVNPLPTVTLEDGYICIDPITLAVTRPYLLNTGLNEAEFTFVWSDANGVIPMASNSFYEANAVGQYSVTITNIITGCKGSAVANVDSSSPPTDFDYTVTGFFANNPTVVINATPLGQYEYQMDFGPFQQSNVFENLTAGTHTITVRDAQACDVLTKSVLIIDYPRYFTPNGDGINDTWNIRTINGISLTKIYIFDRFGKLVKEMSTSGLGWDGTFNGQALPATDYWFTIQYQEAGINKEFRAHFSLKR